MSPLNLVGLGALAVAILVFFVWVARWAGEPEHVTLQRYRDQRARAEQRAQRRATRAIGRSWAPNS